MKFGDILTFDKRTVLIILNDDGYSCEMMIFPGKLVVTALCEDVDELLESGLVKFHESGMGRGEEEWF